MGGLEIRNLSQSFARDDGSRLVVLENISLEVADKEFVCILGSSGCGKTTLLRMIAGLDTAESGAILLDGKEMHGTSDKVGMVFQEYSLFPWRTVIDNIAFGLEMQGMKKEERYRVAEEYLQLVNLAQFRDSYPSQLSGGMRQRVAVARALALDPSVLLMDEPFGALDAQTRNMLQTELLEIWEKTKKTVIFITHSVDEAVFLADRIVVMTPRPGRVCRIFPVDLPRPRDRTGPKFAEVRREVLDLISQKCSIQ
ncbi:MULTISPECIES: ABC transporter ATP-binding protein [unclassified Methanoregula]|uniref:ABC transporter ATP-binding protein n=1 Tax=unclassified Methanoregula TaxID=2649730 RepID=UPI0009CDA911|nr:MULTISPECIES: ABC transporter ATP-binding protein [unclassified Methanoregula]OPX62166.1 MAG: Trehalose/maltose import ATP-binding protein MalK [Methanoregula sp. PtaB.Bin085]OPY35625.1 MAG: Trehalose/maltose import ATP-binding protein MalK [Methanoregula sp. PtaU1.Bin006]